MATRVFILCLPALVRWSKYARYAGLWRTATMARSQSVRRAYRLPALDSRDGLLELGDLAVAHPDLPHQGPDFDRQRSVKPLGRDAGACGFDQARQLPVPEPARTGFPEARDQLFR